MTDDETARGRVLAAADRLFYERGIRAVGMDDVRDAAEISLKRLYRLYPTKERLAQEVLRHRDLDFRRFLAAQIGDLPTPRDRILRIFDVLHDWFREPDFHGCPFINAFGEMRAASDGVTAAVRDQKQALAGLLSELTAAAGAPPSLARQLLVLANGAMVVAAVQNSPAAAIDAKAAASLLLAPYERPTTSPS